MFRSSSINWPARHRHPGPIIGDRGQSQAIVKATDARLPVLVAVLAEAGHMSRRRLGLGLLLATTEFLADLLVDAGIKRRREKDVLLEHFVTEPDKPAALETGPHEDGSIGVPRQMT